MSCAANAGVSCLHCRAQLAGLVSERDGLREDLHSQREAKRMSDQGWKSERQKVQNLEKELAFYQSQSTRYMWQPLLLYDLPLLELGAGYIRGKHCAAHCRQGRGSAAFVGPVHRSLECQGAEYGAGAGVLPRTQHQVSAGWWSCMLPGEGGSASVRPV